MNKNTSRRKDNLRTCTRAQVHRLPSLFDRAINRWFLHRCPLKCIDRFTNCFLCELCRIGYNLNGGFKIKARRFYAKSKSKLVDFVETHQGSNGFRRTSCGNNQKSSCQWIKRSSVTNLDSLDALNGRNSPANLANDMEGCLTI